MDEIDSNDFAGPDVSRTESIDFYKQLSDRCTERAELIQSELDDEGDG